MNRLPMAMGPEPTRPATSAAGPFAIRDGNGLGFLVIRGTGMAFTCAMNAAQLRALASQATAAAARIEAGDGADIVPIFGPNFGR